MALFNPLKTGEIYDGIYSINCGMVNMFIIKNGANFIAIDAGINKTIVSAGINKIKINPNSVNHIFFTHTDYDHKGGVSLFKNAKIYISKEEEGMIKRKVSRKFGIMYNKPFNREYELLNDGQVIEIDALKIRCILTPGHTIGSMSYLINNELLFTGDTLRFSSGIVKNFPSFINMNTKLQKESIKKIAKLDGVKKIFTAHSGMNDDFEVAFKDWK